MQKIDIDNNEHLTQKDIVQLLLHNAQHMVTREELRQDISKVGDQKGIKHHFEKYSIFQEYLLK